MAQWRYRIAVTGVVDRCDDPVDAGQRIADRIRKADIEDEQIRDALDEFADRFEAADSEDQIDDILREMYEYGDANSVFFGGRVDSSDSDDDDDDDDEGEEE
jgi:hypothetical protein